MSEAQRLANHLERVWCDKESAAELRRLNEAHDWQYRMAGDRLRRIEVLEAECEQLRADAARLAYLVKHDSEWALCVFDHDGGYWIHDGRAPDVVRADIDAAIAKETK